jgi:hypothetical protein
MSVRGSRSPRLRSNATRADSGASAQATGIRLVPGMPRTCNTRAPGPAALRDAELGRGSRVEVWPGCNSQHFLCGSRGWRPNFSLGGEDTHLCFTAQGTCMGETLLLLSCGAAFLTGLGIAAVSLFS